jgi:hypothetical protein
MESHRQIRLWSVQPLPIKVLASRAVLPDWAGNLATLPAFNLGRGVFAQTLRDEPLKPCLVSRRRSCLNPLNPSAVWMSVKTDGSTQERHLNVCFSAYQHTVSTNLGQWVFSNKRHWKVVKETSIVKSAVI